MALPTDLLYTEEHEWIRRESDNTLVVGITDYALEQLGDVVFLELPENNVTFDEGDSFGTIESTKTVSDLYMPVSGKVVKINQDLTENLEGLAKDPYQKGWLIKIQADSEATGLLTSAEYTSFISEIE
ncbi:MAG TPA: glycine cleavage system protein GcvH [Acidimicrobiaceae bacterium]|nr:glycine cleavage system protein GcvH [Acidimicrobiaceae bacterium]